MLGLLPLLSLHVLSDPNGCTLQFPLMCPNVVMLCGHAAPVWRLSLRVPLCGGYLCQSSLTHEGVSMLGIVTLNQLPYIIRNHLCACYQDGQVAALATVHYIYTYRQWIEEDCLPV